ENCGRKRGVGLEKGCLAGCPGSPGRRAKRDGCRGEKTSGSPSATSGVTIIVHQDFCSFRRASDQKKRRTGQLRSTGSNLVFTRSCGRLGGRQFQRDAAEKNESWPARCRPGRRDSRS